MLPIIVYKSDIVAAKLQYKEFLAGKSGDFTTGLFNLISHADIPNRLKLAKAFPAHVFAYMQYVGELNLIDFTVKDA